MDAQPDLPGSMTVRQFNEAAKLTGLSPLQRARVRRVLVDGEDAEDVADFAGMDETAVNEEIHKVYSRLDDQRKPLPPLSPPKRG